MIAGHECVITKRRIDGRAQWGVACSCGWTDTRVYAAKRKHAVERWEKHIDSIRPPCPQPQKTRYGNQQEAENALGRSAHGGKLPSRAYECRCGFWHLTSVDRETYERRVSGHR